MMLPLAQRRWTGARGCGAAAGDHGAQDAPTRLPDRRGGGVPPSEIVHAGVAAGGASVSRVRAGVRGHVLWRAGKSFGPLRARIAPFQLCSLCAGIRPV
eukprot:1177920-Prorocentrum_minimum.AAC.6